jgi:GT2 family glycosyltransferase
LESSPEFVSIVITARNEERHIARLLESLVAQEPPFEIILVDALSTDRTASIATEFARTHPEVRVVARYGSRGTGRNAGVALARGAWIAFTDGDCFADSGWLANLREGFRQSDVVAGRTVAVGPPAYVQLERVELYQSGSDVTFPSCNLGYRKELFQRLGGFDARFITAEDIDINLRAVRTGAPIRFLPQAIIYHETRPTLFRFFYQAFWNGYGRKQLTEKHGSLWARYRYRRLLSGQRAVIAWARLVAALSGYFVRVLTGGGRRLSSAPPVRIDSEATAPG